MSNRRRENLQEVGLFDIVHFCVSVGLFVAFIFFLSVIPHVVLVAIANFFKVFVVLIFGSFPVLVAYLVWERCRGSQAPAGLRTVLRPTPRTLRWVRGLLPGDEGAAWLVEVGSCLAEARDKGERRRYVRSYRRNVPQLIWTSWAEHLSASRQRELL